MHEGVERLAVREGMPLLAARYRVTGRLGEGTFAQLVAATDEYRARPGVDAAVAIKIMHTPYGLIGERVRWRVRTPVRTDLAARRTRLTRRRAMLARVRRRRRCCGR